MSTKYLKNNAENLYQLTFSKPKLELNKDNGIKLKVNQYRKTYSSSTTKFKSRPRSSCVNYKIDYSPDGYANYTLKSNTAYLNEATTQVT